MLNKFLILSAILILSACATTAPVTKIEIQKVEVPISVPCKAKIPDTPAFTFQTLQESQNIHDKSKVLLADRQLHLGYEVELLAALNSCIK